MNVALHDSSLAQGEVIPALPSPALLELRVGGHDLRLFTESGPLFAAMLDDIRSAHHRVWLESYIFLADGVGRRIGEALKERARAGVDVRVLYDAVGSYSTPGRFFQELSESGVQVHAYHSLGEALWRLSPFRVLNRRTHRKLLVVDDRVAYFGGMNIVDQGDISTVQEAKAHHLPASAGWRDLHLRLSGPRQAEIAQAFERLWRRVHKQTRPRWPRWPVREMLGSPPESLFFFDSRPGWRYRNPARVFVPLIRRARRCITLSMAYFIPVGPVLRELCRARRRGVRIRVIIPAESDVRLAQWATRHLLAKLLRRGFRIFERKDQMLHSKVMVIDDRWTVVGSCNLDPRSLRLNLEFLGVIHSRAMAEAVNRICAFEMRQSRRVTLEDCRRRTWWQGLLDRAAWSLRRLL